jgi:peptidoglycan-N-acetylmuramic acid deacetylase
LTAKNVDYDLKEYKKMKSRVITLCTLFIIMGAVVLFTGCEPNVNNDGMAGGTTPLETTPRVPDVTHAPNTPNHPGATFTTPITPSAGDNDINEPESGFDNEPAVGGIPPTASFYDDVAPIPVMAMINDFENNNDENDESPPIELSGLCENKTGWGLGRHTDSKNRPTDALIAQNKYAHLGAIFIDGKTENKIYLTFDEGYENGFTPPILDALRDRGAKATFFITFDYARNEPGLIKRMINEGHEIANHSFSHPSFPGLTDEQVRDEIMKLHDYVKENFNYEMRLIRFPMGEFSERVLAITANLGYRSVFWSFAYVDWQVDNQPSFNEAFERITAASHPGAVVLLHAVSETNAEVLPSVIDYWIENGFELALFE